MYALAVVLDSTIVALLLVSCVLSVRSSLCNAWVRGQQFKQQCCIVCIGCSITVIALLGFLCVLTGRSRLHEARVRGPSVLHCNGFSQHAACTDLNRATMPHGIHVDCLWSTRHRRCPMLLSWGEGPDRHHYTGERRTMMQHAD